MFNEGIEVGRFFLECYKREDFFGFSVVLGYSHRIESFLLFIQVGYGVLMLGVDFTK